MQQGARALQSLGFGDYASIGIQSMRHSVYTTEGREVGRWGRETHKRNPRRATATRQNVHIPRQRLRQVLAEQLRPGTIRWGARLVRYVEDPPCTCGSRDAGPSAGASAGADAAAGAGASAANAAASSTSAGTASAGASSAPSGGSGTCTCAAGGRAPGVTLHFDDGRVARAAVLVGADGIFSNVRAQKIGDDLSPLR